MASCAYFVSPKATKNRAKRQKNLYLQVADKGHPIQWHNVSKGSCKKRKLDEEYLDDVHIPAEGVLK